MAVQMTITLTDEEYADLVMQSEQRGKPIEVLVHEAIVLQKQTSSLSEHPMTEEEFTEYLYRKRIILHIPTGEPLTPEEDDDRERLAQIFASGKPASEMVIEDRGPR